MDFTYESQGTSTYLVYEIKDNDEIDSMSLGMMTNNKIVGFAPTFFTQMDAKKFIKYNVSSKVSVKQFFNGPVNKKRLLGVFEGILDGLLSAEDYMIDPKTIVLDLDYIFADVSTCEATLISLPVVVNDSDSTDLSSFFKNIMFTTQFDQTENCDHVAKIINFLNGSPIVSVADFKKLIQSIKEASQPVKQPKTVVQPVVQPTKVNAPISTSTVVASVPPASNANSQVAPKLATKPVHQPHVPTQPSIPTVDNGASSPKQSDSDKKIGMMDLLMHYSKENVALYKAQKASKKGVQKQVTPNPVSPKQPAKQGVNPGFAIPGQAMQIPTQPSNQPTQQPQTNTTAPKSQPVVSTQVQQPIYTVPQTSQGKPANFGETTVLGGGVNGETTVLSSVQNPTQVATPHLIRAKNNERIPLNKPVFRIGKERSYVDYFIGDNTAISRSHANIIIRDGKYFVVDTNSTNHTFVNGNMIQSSVETEISHGDKIRLANEDFEFKVY